MKITCRTITLLASASIFLSSCAFKGKKDDVAQEALDNRPYYQIPSADLSKMDSDGDSINDLEEKNRGTSPFIADLPKFKLNFMQDYSINIEYLANEKTQNFLIDTKVARSSPDFKYRVGDLLIKEISQKSAAEVGQFGDHTNGNFEPRDLSWVKYPEIDSANFQQSVLQGSKLFSNQYKIKNISINLENALKLLPSNLFPEIKDLEVNFYYFDYQKEQYELLKTEVINKHFVLDVNELFSVKIDSVPASFIYDNYFKKGEFIFAEVKDFIIPSLNNMKYSELLKSIKEKSNQVIITTPKDTQTLYVGFNAKAKNLNQYLSSIFDKNYEISENKVLRLGEFLNNLDSYQYLSELRQADKTGKWFVLTQKINKHYLDFEFGIQDPLILSYVTGSDLSQQVEARVSSEFRNIKGGNDYQYYELGSISKNTTLDLQLMPLRADGVSLDQDTFIWHHGMVPPCSQCTKPEFYCEYKINRFKNVSDSFSFDKNFKKELENIFVVINEEEVSISSLVLEKKASFKWVGQNLHLKISDVSKILDFPPSSQALVKLKISTPKKSDFNGIKWVKESGRDGKRACFINLQAYAHKNNIPISVDSIFYDEWKNFVRWDLVTQGASGAKEYYLDHTMDLSVVINNYFN